MLKRLMRLIVGIITIVTLPITLIPFLLIWVVTNRNYIDDIAEWCILGKIIKKYE